MSNTATAFENVSVVKQANVVTVTAAAPAPAMEQTRVAQPNRGGPASNFFTSILTALTVMVAGLGLNVLVFAVLAAIILLVVWLMRRR